MLGAGRCQVCSAGVVEARDPQGAAAGRGLFLVTRSTNTNFRLSPNCDKVTDQRPFAAKLILHGTETRFIMYRS